MPGTVLSTRDIEMSLRNAQVGMVETIRHQNNCEPGQYPGNRGLRTKSEEAMPDSAGRVGIGDRGAAL